MLGGTRLEVGKMLGRKSCCLASSLLALGLLIPLQGKIVNAFQPVPPPATVPEPTPDGTTTEPAPDRILDAITFGGDRDTLYVSVREVASAAGWRLRWDRRARALLLNNQRLPAKRLRHLLDGTQLVALSALIDRGVPVAWDDSLQLARV